MSDHKPSSVIITDFLQQYDLYKSFFRQKYLLYFMAILVIAFFVPSHAMIKTFALILFGLLSTVITAGEYKVLLNFYDTGLMQELPLKEYVKRLPSLSFVYFLGSPFFGLIGTLLAMALPLMYIIIHVEELRVLLSSQSYFFYLFVAALLCLMIIAIAPFGYLMHRFQFAFVSIMDKNAGICQAVKESWALTARGFFALRRMHNELREQFHSSYELYNKAHRMVCDVILYRTLEAEKNNL